MKTQEAGNEFMSAADGRRGVVGRAAEVAAACWFARTGTLQGGIDGS